MKRLLALAVALMLLVPLAHAAKAQTAQPVSLCGGMAYQANGLPMPLTQTTGGALCGKFGIDQSTPGVSNQVSTAPSGANVSDTPTIQNAQYVSGNCMGGFQTVALGSTASVLSQVGLFSKGGLATAKMLYLFSANPASSTCTDRGTFTLAAADVSKVLSIQSITPAAPTGTTVTQGAASTLALGIPSGGTIYAGIVETTTETPPSTSDLVLNFSVF